MQLSPIVILRRVYLGIVSNNHCAAKLIEYFRHWTEWKLEHHRTGWVYMPVRQICLDLMGEHSPNIVRRAIALLIEKGILEQRRNPGNGQDRTWQYRLNQQALDEKLSAGVETREEIDQKPSTISADKAILNSEVPMLRSEQYLQNQSTNFKSTTNNNVVEEKRVAEEKWERIVPKTDELSTDEPTAEELDKAIAEISGLSPDLRPNPTVRKFLIKYWTNLPAALNHVKKVVRENWWVKSLNAVLVSALKEPPEEMSSNYMPHPAGRVYTAADFERPDLPPLHPAFLAAAKFADSRGCRTP